MREPEVAESSPKTGHPRPPGGDALLRLLQVVDSRGLVQIGDAAVEAAVPQNVTVSAKSSRAIVRAAPPELLAEMRPSKPPTRSRRRKTTDPNDDDAAPNASDGAAEAAREASAVAQLYADAAADLGPPVAGRPAWRSVGPGTITNGQTYGTGGNNRVNVSGRVSALAVDPSDANHVLAGAANGGVWESRNRGASWTPRTDYATTTTVGALAFDRTNPSRVLCGTGEGDWWSYLGQGILRSTDGGASWTPLATAPFTGQGFYGLIVDRGNANHVIAATTGGLYQSNDAGVTWTRSRAARTWAVSMAPAGRAGAEVLAGCSDGVYRSTNSGGTWTRVALPGGPAAFDRVSVSIAPSNPAVAYAWGASGGAGFLWRRAGGTWTALGMPTGVDVGQAWYDWYVAAAPDSDTQVYIGAVNLHRGDLAGTTWTWTNLSAKSSGDSIHPDQHSIAFDPVNAATVYAGNDGGVYVSTDRGAAWQSLNNGLVVSEFEYLAQDVGSSRWLIGGTQDNGTDRWTGSMTWQHVEDADGGDCGVNRTNPATVFHARQWWQLLRSTSRGDFGSWSFISPPQAAGEGSLFYAPFEASASGGDTIAYGGDNLHVSRNNGTAWTQLALPAGERSTAIAVPNADTVVVGTWSGSVYRSRWNGTSWPAVTALTTPRAAYVSDIYVAPANLNRIWLTSSTIGGGRAFRSDDGGTTWVDRTAGLPALPINAVEVDPANSNRVWVAADLGVYQSLDGGATWAGFANGLPNCFIGDLVFHPHARVLRAATRNRGVWEIPVDGWMTSPACGVQWNGSLAASQSRRWFTFNWPATWHVVWTVMPTTPRPGAPQLTWNVQVERASAEYVTYWITVTNLTPAPVNFEGRYAILSRY
jgi:hypothetical protein